MHHATLVLLLFLSMLANGQEGNDVTNSGDDSSGENNDTMTATMTTATATTQIPTTTIATAFPSKSMASGSLTIFQQNHLSSQLNIN